MWTFHIRILFIGLAVIIYCASIFIVATTMGKSSETQVLSAQAIDQATNIAVAQSALEAAQRGDPETAKLTLEDQIRQGLAILHKTRAELVSKNALSEQDRKAIDDAIQSGEKYA